MCMQRTTLRCAMADGGGGTPPVGHVASSASTRSFGSSWSSENAGDAPEELIDEVDVEAYAELLGGEGTVAPQPHLDRQASLYLELLALKTPVQCWAGVEQVPPPPPPHGGRPRKRHHSKKQWRLEHALSGKLATRRMALAAGDMMAVSRLNNEVRDIRSKLADLGAPAPGAGRPARVKRAPDIKPPAATGCVQPVLPVSLLAPHGLDAAQGYYPLHSCAASVIPDALV